MELIRKKRWLRYIPYYSKPEGIVGDAAVNGVCPFHTLQDSDDTDGQREDENFIERLQHHLIQHDPRHDVPGNDAAERQGEKDEGVGPFSDQRGGYGAPRKSGGGSDGAARAGLHDAHDVGIEERTDQKGEKRSAGDAGCQTEDGMEAFLPCPVGRGGEQIGSEAEQNEEEVHEEAEPNDEARLDIAIDFNDAVVDDIGNGEDNETGGQ